MVVQHVGQEEAEQITSTALVQVREELSALEAWTVENPDDQEFASRMIQDIKQRHKLLEKKRKSITAPMNKALKAVNDLFRPPREALENAEKVLKSKIAGYLESVQRGNDEAVEIAASAATPEAAVEALSNIEHVEPPSGVSLRYVWKARVINEQLLDRRFLMPDMSAIKDWMKEHKKPDGSPLAIPGVIFDRETVVVSRAK